MKKALDVRMKKYEKIYSFQVPPKTYTIIRFDGKNFSKYTSKFTKPFDNILSNAMNDAAIAVCKEFNPRLAYTQSDEISILLTDIYNIESELPYDGKIQKLCSIGASIVSNEFNRSMMIALVKSPLEIANFNFAKFDARVFIIPDIREVYNYFVWRQQDATRNSINMAAHAAFGPKAIKYKNTNELQEMLYQNKGINWNDYPEKFKRGCVIKRETYFKETEDNKKLIRNKWAIQATPIFTQEKEFLQNIIVPVL
ncbi:MAG TPA: tRNA(His) guanylyltransferase Thg1 family protein [Candidatus Paceibacterota bacterium]|mgnify:CR=1 FL=1|nr:tRNA(His) guanylyltransferase Thg1 family protein [Candidatus Paceibacterota bacterium]